jgi:hypothetical protein
LVPLQLVILSASLAARGGELCDIELFSLPTIAVDDDPASIAMADFDGGGIQDLVTANWEAGTVSLALGAGDGHFTPSGSHAVGSWPNCVVVGDFDGDGRQDIAATGVDAGSLQVLLHRTKPWADLGFALSGSFGEPQLVGCGPLTPNSTNSLELSGANALAEAHLVAGLGTIYLPFKDGTMVPNPDLILSGLGVDSLGSMSVSFSWPAGLTGLSLYFQVWIKDFGGVGSSGCAASNGLMGTGQ